MTSRQLHPDFARRVERAAESLRAEGFVGEIGMVLGSGQGELLQQVELLRDRAFVDIDGLTPPSVHGHAGRVLHLRHGAKRLLVLDGRLHRYEGHDGAELLVGIGLLHALGCGKLILANAAGGLHPQLRSGDLMLLSDLIDLHLQDPLRGLLPAREREGAHVCPFDPELRQELMRAGMRAGLPLRQGCYASVWGPNYETAAEIRMLRLLGADAVGMSTAPEAIFARALGMRVAGISCITNVAREHAAVVVSHEEVVAVSQSRRDEFARLISSWLEGA